MPLFCDMELELKLPDGKPPFIGIIFQNEWDGYMNKEWADSYHTSLYQLIFEPAGETLKITFSSRNWNFKYTYQPVKYDLDKLKKFMQATKGSRVYNFGHIIWKEGNHKVIRTRANARMILFKIDQVKVVYEY